MNQLPISPSFLIAVLNYGIKYVLNLIQPSDFLSIQTFKNSIIDLYKDELAKAFDPDNHALGV